MAAKKKSPDSSSKSGSTADLLTVLALLILGLGLTGYWASLAPEHRLAQSIRSLLGLPDPALPQVIATPTPPPAPEPEPKQSVPRPVPTLETDPEPTPAITLGEIAKSPNLWPKTLNLTLSKEIPILFNGNEYGRIFFNPESNLLVEAIEAGGYVRGRIEGNPVRLPLNKTTFAGWFAAIHGANFDLQPLPETTVPERTQNRPDISTPEGETAFWTDMRIWCNQNYRSVSLEIGDDALVFRWVTREDQLLGYREEARRIAAKYLELRRRYGSDENYAACEVRHPETNELLGSDSLFMPEF